MLQIFRTVLLLMTPTALLLAASDQPAPLHAPVLLELFTSEGCSSCPPADRLLETFDKEQPITGADLIVISEHVDYWNQLGWQDPFSSPFYTARQRDYTSRLKAPEVYTPQLVIDGNAQVVGNDRPNVEAAIRNELKREKIAIMVDAARPDAIHVNAPAQDSPHKYDIYVVLAANHMRSQVARGENAGHTLNHVAVAYSFKKVGIWNTAEPLTRDLSISPKPAESRAIVFLQDSKTGQIAGAGQARIQSN